MLHAIEKVSIKEKKVKKSFTYLRSVTQKEAQGYQQAADHHKCDAHDGTDFGHNYPFMKETLSSRICVINGAKEMIICSATLSYVQGGPTSLCPTQPSRL